MYRNAKAFELQLQRSDGGRRERCRLRGQKIPTAVEALGIDLNLTDDSRQTTASKRFFAAALTNSSLLLNLKFLLYPWSCMTERQDAVAVLYRVHKATLCHAVARPLRQAQSEL